MSITKADVCEIEIQEQTAEDAGCKYMVLVKTADINSGAINITKIILTDQKPIIKQTIDDGKTVNVKDN
jgi:hypothetical protein|tara:strand:+ start:164 stop:370 length:207 start_codon:yes stop_codon:yes gene_type:complete